MATFVRTIEDVIHPQALGPNHPKALTLDPSSKLNPKTKTEASNAPLRL